MQIIKVIIFLIFRITLIRIYYKFYFIKIMKKNLFE